MKKIGLLFREKLQDVFSKEIQANNNFLVISYSGTAAADFSALRGKLRRTGARTMVVRNSLIRMLLKARGMENITRFIDGPTAFITGVDDPVTTSKVLIDFIKEHENVNLRGGFLDNQFIDPNDVKRISQIPSKEVLYSILCQTLNSPIRGFVTLLNNNIKQFLFLLTQISEKRR